MASTSTTDSRIRIIIFFFSDYGMPYLERNKNQLTYILDYSASSGFLMISRKLLVNGSICLFLNFGGDESEMVGPALHNACKDFRSTNWSWVSVSNKLRPFSITALMCPFHWWWHDNYHLAFISKIKMLAYLAHDLRYLFEVNQSFAMKDRFKHSKMCQYCVRKLIVLSSSPVISIVQNLYSIVFLLLQYMF